MNAKQIHEEIKETNLSFMLLAQQMIRGNKVQAMASFGVNEEMADLVAGLSPAQLLKMSASNMLLCCFHFDESMLLDMISSHKKEVLMDKSGTQQVKAARKAEALAA